MTRFLGDWIEMEDEDDEPKISVNKNYVICYKTRDDHLEGTEFICLNGRHFVCDMSYEEFKANMHINLNPSYDQRKQQAYEFFRH